MRYVALKHDIRWPDREVTKGTIIGVEDNRDAEIVFILTGDLKNRSIHTDNIHDVDMLELLDQARADEQLAVKNADRLTDRIIELERQLINLPAKKVSLPRNIADAIKQTWDLVYRSQPKSVKHLALTNWDLLERRAEKHVSVLHQYALHHPMEYISALVDGFTIEQTPEERWKSGIDEVVEKWKRNGNGNIANLAKSLNQYAKDFIAQSTAANG